MTTTEIIGLEHIYLSVASMPASEAFYDGLLVDVLGFRKRPFTLAGDDHIHYYNRHFGFVIRPARAGAPPHDRRAPGLHHLCLRVTDAADVDRVGAALATREGLTLEPPRLYPDYAPDYYALFLTDPDGVRLEITNFREERRTRMQRWDDSAAET